MESKALIDLGWHNIGGEIAKTIDKYREMCRSLKHEPSDKDVSTYGSGAEHVVTCEPCGYVYRYDSSD